ncbi:NAD(P)H-binding protein [Streptosporangium sp. NPDC048865]|uniref:NAD(P)H-binding protein n=1 Tax=Streptosporangium sp. NPDC048865 TaxID=3155766 RepID=UPI003420FA09
MLAFTIAIGHEAAPPGGKETTIMKVFQIGVAGGVGRRLARLLTARGDEVTGMHRDPAQAQTVRAAGATPLAGDLVVDSVGELARKLGEHDAVVFSAGAHGTGLDKTTAIDGKGLEKAADAAAQAGVSRFVLVSVFPEAGRGRQTSEGFEHYMKVKKSADVHLTRSGLDWLIVRPGTLLDEPGTGRVTAGPAVEYGGVPRDDVAAFIDAALHEPTLNRVIVELTTGQTPVTDAVALLVTSSTSRRPS